MRLSESQKTEIEQITKETLHSLLCFHVSHKALEFVHEDSTTNWRELEDKLHHEYPVKGVGVLATRSNLKKIYEFDGGFLHTEEDLYPGDVPAELDSYPYQAASSAYLYTQIEAYGDSIVNLMNPRYLKRHQSWHHGIYNGIDLTTKEKRHEARKNFSHPFGRPASAVPDYAVKRLIWLKRYRNEFIHTGESSINFDNFYAYTLSTLVSIYFLAIPSAPQIKCYPYFDYEDKWK